MSTTRRYMVAGRCVMSATDNPIQYGPPPLRPGYRWETAAERAARYAALDRAEQARTPGGAR